MSSVHLSTGVVDFEQVAAALDPVDPLILSHLVFVALVDQGVVVDRHGEDRVLVVVLTDDATAVRIEAGKECLEEPLSDPVNILEHAGRHHWHGDGLRGLRLCRPRDRVLIQKLQLREPARQHLCQGELREEDRIVGDDEVPQVFELPDRRHVSQRRDVVRAEIQVLQLWKGDGEGPHQGEALQLVAAELQAGDALDSLLGRLHDVLDEHGEDAVQLWVREPLEADLLHLRLARQVAEVDDFGVAVVSPAQDGKQLAFCKLVPSGVVEGELWLLSTARVASVRSAAVECDVHYGSGKLVVVAGQKEARVFRGDSDRKRVAIHSRLHSKLV